MNLTDTEWLENKEASGKITRTIYYTVPDAEGKMESQSVDVDIYVLPGTKYARYQDAMIERDAMGNMSINSANGTKELLMMSLGISHEQLDLIKRNKPMGLYQSLITAVQAINSPNSEKVEEEKNEDGQD